ncbi:MAG: YhbD family protein [Methanomassiliicoccaceae archaeon]|nr:YhbD family protein [Methanomassiliicoccaceae archaeon]MCL2145731.1 YhbD family protein [Methanomassiliicoccaceae archaeon]
MDENLISKKELLELKGISYGTLYRWKRKRLIPDEWFIRRSTFTGQETFFPRDLILERVDSILNSKEETSLDDLAKILSGVPAEINITMDEMKRRGLISEAAAVAAEQFFPGTMDFDGALIVFSLDGPIEDGDLSMEDAKTMMHNMAAVDDREALRQSTVRLYRKQGVAFCAILPDVSKAYMDTSSKLIFEVSMPQMVAAFKAQILLKKGAEDHE